tara:strand:+ start:342 stop:494 length:153 start_codon:yes stop_codon:yes gene_type:complete
LNDEREFRIETPIGTVASDSGNHVVDVVSVLGVIVFIYIIKIIIKGVSNG